MCGAAGAIRRGSYGIVPPHETLGRLPRSNNLEHVDKIDGLPPTETRRRLSMSFLKKLFGKRSQPKERVRVCSQCGMPVTDHKEWCSILKGNKEGDEARLAEAAD